MTDYITASEAEIDAEQQALFGQQQGEITPKMLEVVKLLQSEPLLCGPCLQWCRQALARLAQAKLDVLYSREEQEALRSQMK